MRQAFLLLMGLLFAIPGLTMADDKHLHVNGFMTIAVSQLDGEGTYLNGITKEADMDLNDTKVGLNLFQEMDDNWSSALQFTAREIRQNYALIADWAFLQYEHDSGFSFRVGRQKYNVWLNSEFIDIGRAYPWVRPPEEAYEMFPLKTLTGLNVAWTVDDIIGDYRFRADLYVGTVRDLVAQENSTVVLTSDRTYGATLSLESVSSKFQVSYLTGEIAIDFLGIDERYPELYSAAYYREMGPFEIWLEYAEVRDRAKQSVKDNDRLVAQQNYSAAVASGDSAAIAAAAVQLVLFQGEVIGAKGGYGTLGYRMGKTLLHYTFADLTAIDNAFIAAPQQSHTLGVRYEINPTTDMKFEVKQINIDPDNGEYGNFVITEANPDAKETNYLYSFAFNNNF